MPLTVLGTLSDRHSGPELVIRKESSIQTPISRTSIPIKWQAPCVGGPGTILATGLVGDQSQAIKAVLDRLDHTLVYVRHLWGKGEIRMFLKSRLVVGSWAWREIGPAASRACLRASIPSSRVSSKFAT